MSDRAWLRALDDVLEERDEPLSALEGTLPAGLRGSFFRNGGGRYQRGGQEFGHWFDGDAHIARYDFRDGGVHYKTRFLQTHEFVDEERSGRVRYKKYGTLRRGGPLNNAFRLRLQNKANTSVVPFGGAYFACWDAGLPYRIDPISLDVVAADVDFEGALAGRAFTSHPCVEPSGESLFGFGVKNGVRAALDVWRITPELRVAALRTLPLDHNYLVHDCAITASRIILMLGSAYVRAAPFVLGLEPVARSVRFDRDLGNQLIVLRKDTLEDEGRVTLPPGFAFHDVNAFDDGDDVVVDYLLYDEYPDLGDAAGFRAMSFDGVPTARPTRVTLSPARGTASTRVLSERRSEFTSIDPRLLGKPYRYVYLNGPAFPRTTSIAKLDIESGALRERDFGAGVYPEEPLFVPRAGGLREDDGYLLVQIYRAEAHRSELFILDAADITAPALARYPLPGHVPYAFHGSFVPS